MIIGMPAMFGMASGEILILLAVLALAVMLVLGAATAVSYFIIVMLSRKRESLPASASGPK